MCSFVRHHHNGIGTATWRCPDLQRNNTSTRVKLHPDFLAGLGKEYIVVLTPRLPDGFPYFILYLTTGWVIIPFRR